MNWIALLRGINVGGKNMIKMPELLKALDMPGIRHPTALLQSGNIIFAADESSPSALEQIIGSRISDVLGLNVTVLVRSGQQWKEIIRNMPWTINSADVTDFGHVTFLKAIPEPEKRDVLEMKAETGESWFLKSQEVYLYCPFGYGRTKLTNSIFERKLGTAATTRNWRTVLAADELLDSTGG